MCAAVCMCVCSPWRVELSSENKKKNIKSAFHSLFRLERPPNRLKKKTCGLNGSMCYRKECVSVNEKVKRLVCACAKCEHVSTGESVRQTAHGPHM